MAFFNQDTLGNKNRIAPGALHITVAGSGVQTGDGEVKNAEVVFVGYGNALDASFTNRPGDLRRTVDGFFVKMSYLFRAGVPRRDMAGVR
ncbi:MAG: hypothetical protein HC938_17155 [Nitrospira sp.]|nr:hypothetical protein [Nitrospira sp.]